MDEESFTQEYTNNTEGIIRPTLAKIRKMYINATIIKSIWGNTFNLDKYDLSKTYRLNNTDIFIPYKDKQNDHKDICVYDYDMNKYAEIIETNK